MEKEKSYTPEEAEEEAAYMQDLIKEGEAKDHKEAEEKIKTWVSNFIQMVKEGKGVPTDFSAGPIAMYGSEYKEPFEGYKDLNGFCKSIKDVEKWKQVLDDKAYNYLLQKLDDDLPYLTEETLDEYEKREGTRDRLWIIYCGKTFQRSKQSEGRGSYHYRHNEGNAYFETSYNNNQYGAQDYYQDCFKDDQWRKRRIFTKSWKKIWPQVADL